MYTIGYLELSEY